MLSNIKKRNQASQDPADRYREAKLIAARGDGQSHAPNAWGQMRSASHLLHEAKPSASGRYEHLGAGKWFQKAEYVVATIWTGYSGSF